MDKVEKGKSVNQEILILSLYKQHFFDQYAPEMDNQYSCWGYYDGISVVPVTEAVEGKDEYKRSEENSHFYGSQIFNKKSRASISKIWCGSMHSSIGLNGLYSKQNIGIFRCNDKEDLPDMKQRKSELVGKSPFFAVAFIQLKDREGFNAFSEKSEEQTEVSEDFCRHYCILKAYYTFDNADTVILLYSNSLQKLDYMLNKLKEDTEVSYIYSIVGVSEQYLKDCKEHILPFWQGVRCFIDEPIAHMFLNIATSGDFDVISKLKNQFKRLDESNALYKDDCDNISFSFVQGKSDIMVDISNIDVSTMISMFLENGMLTHSNRLFGREIYNIETTLAMTEMRLSQISERTDIPEKKNNRNEKKLWFAAMTRKYEALMAQAWEGNDEGTYADYCSLVQISNTLAQYEGFTLSKDLFLLLYSPFKMFHDRLSSALKLVENEKRCENSKNPQIKMQYIKESICEFSQGVNSVIHHTIHNNQFFLMIPGYTGTTFLIPIKLCMMYLWMIKKEITVLNDAGYRYSCLLTPGLESRPESTLINMGLMENDRLIHFSSSQRSLYMPRHFMIILTHEIAHYVGKKLRNRFLRAKCIAETLAYYLAELVVTDDIKAGNSWISSSLYKEIKEKVQIKCGQRMMRKLNNYTDEEQIHATEIVCDFKQICFELVARNGVIDRTIKEVILHLGEKVGDENLLEQAMRLRSLEHDLDENRERLLTSQRTINNCVEELIQIYREVFSDMAAFCLLKCNKEDFSEAFNVSEGKLLSNSSCPDIQKRVRENIVHKVFYSEESEEKIEETFNNPNSKNSSNNIFSYCWTGDLLYKYAKKSREAIDNRAADFKEETERLQNQYLIFASDYYTCSEIYKKIMDAIVEYEREIDREYSIEWK